jgi:hypothetical protein
MSGMILQGIKPRIFNRLIRFGEWWVVELLIMLWSLKTTPSRATGRTPFFMSMALRQYSRPTLTMERRGSCSTENRRPRSTSRMP